MKSVPKERPKKRLVKLRHAFRNENGAIDLASIMVGIIVIGLIGGVIAATVFAVIPWTQDNAAKQQLDSLVSAENAYMGLSSAVPSPLPAGFTPNSFADSTGLANANLLATNQSYCAVTVNNGKNYQGYSASASGSIWTVSDSNTKPASFTGALPTACQGISAGAPVPLTRPADVNAAGITIGSNGGYPAYWTDKTVTAWEGNANAQFGFSISQVSTPAQAANYTVTFSGGGNVGAAVPAAPTLMTGSGVMWDGVIQPVAGGFTAGTGYITATITDKTTGAFSQKTWVLTVLPQSGPVQGSYYSSYWNDKTASNSTSNSSAVFGFRIPFAKASDYTVTYTGASNVGAVMSAVQTLTNDNGGTDWYSVAQPTPGAGGFTTGTGVITATVKYNPTGTTWTKNFNLTVVANPGPVQGAYYSSFWLNKTAAVGSAGNNTFGFSIPGAIASDFVVTFTSTGNVNESTTTPGVGFSNMDNADWYATFTPKAGGWTAGTSTITATATSRSSGQVYTKTYTLTVS